MSLGLVFCDHRRKSVILWNDMKVYKWWQSQNCSVNIITRYCSSLHCSFNGKAIESLLVSSEKLLITLYKQVHTLNKNAHIKAICIIQWESDLIYLVHRPWPWHGGDTFSSRWTGFRRQSITAVCLTSHFCWESVGSHSAALRVWNFTNKPCCHMGTIHNDLPVSASLSLRKICSTYPNPSGGY